MLNKAEQGAEWDYYRAHLEEWCNGGRVGQYVAIHANQLIGFYPSAEVARSEARSVHPDRFLVKLVEVPHSAHCPSRRVTVRAAVA